MSKRKKRLQANRCSLLDCKVRIVEKTDKWCQRKTFNGQVPVGDAPWGYIVTIPYCPGKNTYLDNVDGYIVRTKKKCGNLLLQIVKKEDAPKYGVRSYTRQEQNFKVGKKRKKRNLYRILNIRNFRKSEDMW